MDCPSERGRNYTPVEPVRCVLPEAPCRERMIARSVPASVNHHRGSYTSPALAAASYPFVDLPPGNTLRCKLFPSSKFTIRLFPTAAGHSIMKPAKVKEMDNIMEYIKYLEELIPKKDSLKIVKTEAEKFYKTHSLDECFHMGHELYQSDNFQIQEVGVFLFGYVAHENADALSFLKTTVSQHDSWKVQEILAMAFDNHCKIIGYETALPVIQEWLNSDRANVRRAASEGLRVWTSRPYFKDNPQVAIKLLAAHKSDESEYVRKSIGNAIRDISKKHSELVSKELSTWELSSKEIIQVYKLASKFIEK